MYKRTKAQLKEYKENFSQFQNLLDQKKADKFYVDTAKTIKWNKKGANFQTHSLIQYSTNVLKYKLSIGGIAFIAVFGIPGLGIMLGGLYVFLQNGEASTWLVIGLGSISFAVSISLYKSLGIPTYFDRSIGVIYKGNKAPKLSGNQKQKETIYFADIDAIQILQVHFRSKKYNYDTYNLNLVMKDDTRINITNYGKYKNIVQDVKILSEFLGKPVLDEVNL